MEDLLIAVFGGVIELFLECFSWLGCWWSPWDAELFSPGVMVPLLCIVGGGCMGWLSTLVFKHALLAKSWMRLATLFGMPPLAGWSCHRLGQPLSTREALLRSPRFWLPLLVVLSYGAVRLITIDR